MSLDKRFVDSRRPLRPLNQPIQEDMNEGVMPYRPNLDLMPLRFINYSS